MVSSEPFLAGAIAGRLAARHARDGRSLPAGWLCLPGLAITTGNVDEILARQQPPQARQGWFAARVDDVVNNPTRYLRPLDQAH